MIFRGFTLASLVAQTGKNLPGLQETWILSWVKDLRRAWQPTLLLSGGSHAQRCLVGYSPWITEELDTIEHVPYLHLMLCSW